jgi:hypothetical protein
MVSLVVGVSDVNGDTIVNELATGTGVDFKMVTLPIESYVL